MKLKPLLYPCTIEFSLIEKILNQKPHLSENVWEICKPISGNKNLENCINIAKIFVSKIKNKSNKLLLDLKEFPFESLSKNSTELFHHLFNSISTSDFKNHIDLFINYYKKLSNYTNEPIIILIKNISFLNQISTKEIIKIIQNTPLQLNGIGDPQKKILLDQFIQIILNIKIEDQIFQKINKFIEIYCQLFSYNEIIQLIPIYQTFINHEKNVILLEEIWESFYYFYLEFPNIQQELFSIFINEIERFRNQKISVPAHLLFGFFYQEIERNHLINSNFEENPSLQSFKTQLIDLAFGYFLEQAILQGNLNSVVDFTNFMIDKNLYPEFKHILILKSAFLTYRNSNQQNILTLSKFFSIFQILFERTYSILPVDKLHSFKIFNKFLVGSIVELSFHEIDVNFIPSILNKHLDLLILLYNRSVKNKEIFQNIATDFYLLTINVSTLELKNLHIIFYDKFNNILPEEIASKIYSEMFLMICEFFKTENIINKLLSELSNENLSPELEKFMLDLHSLQKVGSKESESILYTNTIQLALYHCIQFLQTSSLPCDTNELLFFFTEWLFLIFCLRKTIHNPEYLPEINFKNTIDLSLNILSDKFHSPRIINHLWSFFHRIEYQDELRRC